jgi:hypothetical protein
MAEYAIETIASVVVLSFFRRQRYECCSAAVAHSGSDCQAAGKVFGPTAGSLQSPTIASRLM